jgi:branched-chain amino acid transport system permease protein
MGLAAQLLVDGVINGSHYALLGLAFGLIFGPSRITHFAFGPVYALSAYACWTAAVPLGLPLPLAAAAGVAAGALAGVATYRILYRPFERRQSPSLVILIASLGLFIVLENALGVVFGSDTKVVPGFNAAVILLGDVVFTSVQAGQVLALIALALALALFLKRTDYGKAVMAMTDNPEMARIVGIDTVRLTTLVFALGSAMAAVPAVLILLKEGATPYMGFTAVFMAFIAVVVGGIGSLRGAVLAGYALGIVENLGAWQIPTEWQSTIAFVVLFLVLLLKPRGLFGRGAR